MDCVCPAAGYCEIHDRQMSALRHRQCRDEPGYYEAFQLARKGREAKGEPPPASAPPRQLGEGCIHHGSYLTDHACPTCGGGMKQLPVYQCKVREIRRCWDFKAVEGVADCRTCGRFERKP
jgi:hypothetical protein